jgi:hypothetical protein
MFPDEVSAMFTTVKGHFDGKTLVLDEPPPARKPAEVLVTFIGPRKGEPSARKVLDTVLARGPVSIAPLRIRDLIAEGRR